MDNGTKEHWDGLGADQKRAALWVTDRFGSEIQAFLPERVDRVLEEAVELHQSEHAISEAMLQQGWEQAHRIVDRVYGKQPDPPELEIGGVMVTLLAYAEARGFRLDEAAKRELERIETLPREKFITSQQKKAAENIALAPSSVPINQDKLPPVL